MDNNNNNNNLLRILGLYVLSINIIKAGFFILLFLSAFFLSILFGQESQQQQWSYNKFIKKVENGAVERVALTSDKSQAKIPSQQGMIIVNIPEDAQPRKILKKNHVDISVQQKEEGSFWLQAFSSLFLPFFILVGLFFLLLFSLKNNNS